jgi:hypothetical protein
MRELIVFYEFRFQIRMEVLAGGVCFEKRNHLFFFVIDCFSDYAFFGDGVGISDLLVSNIPADDASGSDRGIGRKSQPGAGQFSAS